MPIYHQCHAVKGLDDSRCFSWQELVSPPCFLSLPRDPPSVSTSTARARLPAALDFRPGPGASQKGRQVQTPAGDGAEGSGGFVPARVSRAAGTPLADEPAVPVSRGTLGFPAEPETPICIATKSVRDARRSRRGTRLRLAGSTSAGQNADPPDPASQRPLCPGIASRWMGTGPRRAGDAQLPLPGTPGRRLPRLWLLPSGKAAQSLLQHRLHAPLGCPVCITARRQPSLSFP